MEYPAILTTQVEGGREVVYFSAPATEIDVWAGVPQKKGSVEEAETTGFQRDENPKRIDSIVAFLKDSHNVLQNPLLCATQSDICGKVEFLPDEDQTASSRTHTGKLLIEVDDLSSRSLLDLMVMVKTQLESRVPELTSHAVEPTLINDLKRRSELPELADDEFDDDQQREDEDQDVEELEPDSTQEATEVVFSDESHILDFWHELAARIHVLQEIGGTYTGNAFLGFTRDAMMSFLKPIVVMDGQHRLRGAIYTAQRLANADAAREQIEAAVDQGEDPGTIQSSTERQVSRWLPVSLLLTDDPAEHVFQFIVVNQKATPIGKALLGTIVSTTLSNDELARVSERLTAADIRLEQSRAVAYLSRNPCSPFKDRVETGMAGESTDRLAWSVMASLVKVFQKLKGGKLFGQKIDFADKWRRDCLEQCGIVAESAEQGFDSSYDYWSSSDGPWRDVFIAFFTAIKKEFGKTDPESWAYWGTPKTSNLFNKISLTILAADFFQFLVDRQYTIDSVDDVQVRVDDWLNDVSRDYFNRDWRLAGAKKDSVGVRNNWAKLWVDYRKDPIRMPKSSEYKKHL